jgi:hypothetical protein
MNFLPAFPLFLRPISLVVVSLLFLLTACQEGSEDSKGGFLGLSLGGSAPEVVVEGTLVAAETVPWHIQSTVAATILRLKGQSPAEIEPELRIAGSGGIAEDKNTNLKDFGVQNILINDFFHPEEAPELYRLGARLVLVDPAGRRLGLSFVADYELVDDQVILKGYDWAYIRSAFPSVETYIVEAETLKPLDKETALDYASFRAHILSNAVSTGGNADTLVENNYSIVTFVADRLLEGDKFETRISDVKDGTDGYTEDSRYIVHDNGWVTSIVTGRFSLRPNTSFWIKAVYTPKPENEGLLGLINNETLIGLFNTADLADPFS